jgi:hypothetical protein
MYSSKAVYLLKQKQLSKSTPFTKAKLLSYMKLMDVPLGLLINFHVEKLTDGVSRMMLPGANGKQRSKQEGTEVTEKEEE